MKSFLAKAWRGFVAGATSTDAVKAEKSLGVLIAVRVLLAVGGSDALVHFVQSLTH